MLLFYSTYKYVCFFSSFLFRFLYAYIYVYEYVYIHICMYIIIFHLIRTYRIKFNGKLDFYQVQN